MTRSWRRMALGVVAASVAALIGCSSASVPLTAKARRLAAAGDRAGALEAARAAVTADPRDADAHALVGELALHAGRPTEALRELADARDRGAHIDDATLARLYAARGVMRADTQQLERWRDFERAVALDPHLANSLAESRRDALLDGGIARWRAGDEAGARKLFALQPPPALDAAAVLADPDHADLLALTRVVKHDAVFADAKVLAAAVRRRALVGVIILQDSTGYPTAPGSYDLALAAWLDGTADSPYDDPSLFAALAGGGQTEVPPWVPALARAARDESVRYDDAWTGEFVEPLAAIAAQALIEPGHLAASAFTTDGAGGQLARLRPSHPEAAAALAAGRAHDPMPLLRGGDFGALAGEHAEPTLVACFTATYMRAFGKDGLADLVGVVEPPIDVAPLAALAANAPSLGACQAGLVHMRGAWVGPLAPALLAMVPARVDAAAFATAARRYVDTAVDPLARLNEVTRLALARGDAKDALAFAEEALALEPGDGLAGPYAMQAAIALGKPEKAQLIATTSEYWSARPGVMSRRAASAFLTAGDGVNALIAAKVALGLAGPTAEVSTMLVRAACAIGRDDDAVRYAKAFLAVAPRDQRMPWAFDTLRRCRAPSGELATLLAVPSILPPPPAATDDAAARRNAEMALGRWPWSVPALTLRAQLEGKDSLLRRQLAARLLLIGLAADDADRADAALTAFVALVDGPGRDALATDIAREIRSRRREPR